MPLSTTQPPGLRIMIWTMPIVTAALGAGFLVFSDSRFQAAGFVPARLVFSWATSHPMKVWGVVFVVIAAAKIYTILWHRVQPFLVAMCLGLGLYVFWAVLFVVAFLHDGLTSPVGPVLFTGWSTLHVAALRTLTDPSPVRSPRDGD